jgi:hypothetical protein
VNKEEKDESGLSAFEIELKKKIRNKTKKLEQISELEQKVKKGEIVPNQEQLIKIASKTAIELEINDVNQYLAMFKDCEKE